MVGAPATTGAVARAKRLPDLAVGLHLTLIEGWPSAPAHEVAPLLTTSGTFDNRQIVASCKWFFSPRARQALAREIRAQFEAFRQTGLILDHVNAHKHMQLHPTIARLIIEIGREYGIRALRVPYEPPPIIARLAPGAPPSWGNKLLALWTRQLRRAAQQAGLITNDTMFGLAWTGAMNEARLLQLIGAVPNGRSEIYLHPATATTRFLSHTMPHYDHAGELAALLSPKVRQAINQAGFCLGGYRDF